MNKSSAFIEFHNINVNVIDNTSGVFVGTNSQLGWVANAKTNSGFGSVSGDGIIVNKNINIVFDDDFIDSPIQQQKGFFYPRQKS